MRRVSLFMSKELLDGLERLKERYGTPQAESVRRAVAAYLAEKRMLRRHAPGENKGRRPKRSR
jgi:metal-responsive CopG/Arc/MetJ family transcriptional regulator